MIRRNAPLGRRDVARTLTFGMLAMIWRGLLNCLLTPGRLALRLLALSALCRAAGLAFVLIASWMVARFVMDEYSTWLFEQQKTILRSVADNARPQTTSDDYHAQRPDNVIYVSRVPCQAEQPLSTNWPYVTASDATNQIATTSPLQPSDGTSDEDAESHGEALVLARYVVSMPPKKSEKPLSFVPKLFVAEVVMRETADELRVMIDVGYQHAPGVFRRLPWWRGLTPSNEVLVIRRGALGLRTVEFPATINAFAAYLEERFLDEVKVLNAGYQTEPTLKLSSQQMVTAVVGPMLTRLTNDFDQALNSVPSYLLLLSSAPIQFICLVIALAVLVVLAARFLLTGLLEKVYAYWVQRRWKRAATAQAGNGSLEDQVRFSAALSSMRSLHRRLFGYESPVLLAMETLSLDLRGNSAATSMAADEGQRAAANLATYRGLLEQLISVIPLTGYVGTLYFMAMSFPLADDLISSSQAKMLAALSAFTRLMAGAFTTSLWSSGWNQLCLWLNAAQTASEERRELSLVTQIKSFTTLRQELTQNKQSGERNRLATLLKQRQFPRNSNAADSR